MSLCKAYCYFHNLSSRNTILIMYQLQQWFPRSRHNHWFPLYQSLHCKAAVFLVVKQVALSHTARALQQWKLRCSVTRKRAAPAPHLVLLSAEGFLFCLLLLCWGEGRNNRREQLCVLREISIYAEISSYTSRGLVCYAIHLLLLTFIFCA